MRFAFFGFPHFGGTYTVYAALRAGLAQHGVEVRWLGVGHKAMAAWDDPMWAGERDNGEAIDLPEAGDAAVAQAMVEHIGAYSYDGVFVNVLADKVQTNAIRFMRPSIRRIMLVHTPSIGTLKVARLMGPYVHASVGVSARTHRELLRRGFDAERTVAIPNGVDLSRYIEVRRIPALDGRLRLLSFGRIEEAAKGVFWLPRIMSQLAGIDVHLVVAGDGPDRRELERRCAAHGTRITFLGRIPAEDVPALYARHDLFLMPSRHEGFGQTIIEAMATGCVPVVSRIRGVTDTIVTDSEDGFLFPVGDVKVAAAAVRRLAGSRAQLARMSAAARRSVQGRFGIERQAAAYAELIGRIMRDRPPIAAPLPLDAWSYPRGLRPGLRTYLPSPLKNLLRTWKERLAA